MSDAFTACSWENVCGNGWTRSSSIRQLFCNPNRTSPFARQNICMWSVEPAGTNLCMPNCRWHESMVCTNAACLYENRLWTIDWLNSTFPVASYPRLTICINEIEKIFLVFERKRFAKCKIHLLSAAHTRKHPIKHSAAFSKISPGFDTLLPPTSSHFCANSRKSKHTAYITGRHQFSSFIACNHLMTPCAQAVWCLYAST